MITLSNVFHRNQQALKSKLRYIVNRGGTSSTKTWSILQLLTDISRKKDWKIDIVGQSVPHLKGGVINDMPNVVKDFGIVFDDCYNSTDKVFKQKGTINFLSVDKLGKALGGRRDVLFLNEANHIPWNIVEQLMIRTRVAIFIDYNPTSEFWVHTHLMRTEKDKLIEIVSTYKDNPRLEQSIIDAIEAKRGDNNFWRVYGLGEMGRAEGLVFNNYKTNQQFDKEQFDNYRHGVDWGFSIDPFAYNRLAIDLKKRKIWICDEIDCKNTPNSKSAEMVKRIAFNDVVWCDSAEPKSVEEFCSYGVNAKGAKKGQGSIESGIRFLQEFEIIIHSDCVRTAEEFNNYAWKMDKRTGEPLNVPEDSFNHHIDAIRYSIFNDISGEAVSGFLVF